MKNSEVALSDCKKVQNNFFRLHMNEIGVICLNDIEYQIFLGSFNRDKKIVEYIKKVSHKKEEKYYLRGRYYYYWLPSYITGSLVSLFSRNKLMHCTVKYMKNKSYKDLAIC